VSVIARPARRITYQHDNPRRKTTRPCPDLGKRQCRSAAGLPPDCSAFTVRRTESLCTWLTAPATAAARDGAGSDDRDGNRPSARLSANHRAVPAAAAIPHPRLVRAPPKTGKGVAPSAHHPCLASRPAGALSAPVPRSKHVSRRARLTASGP
jgi:hypothetical protein